MPYVYRTSIPVGGKPPRDGWKRWVDTTLLPAVTGASPHPHIRPFPMKAEEKRLTNLSGPPPGPNVAGPSYFSSSLPPALSHYRYPFQCLDTVEQIGSAATPTIQRRSLYIHR